MKPLFLIKPKQVTEMMKRRCGQSVMAMMVLVMLNVGASAWAADYYVDQGHARASDNNPGTEAQPWATLYRAAEAALKPGDTVYVKKGSYDVSTGGHWSRPAINIPSGTPDRPITFKSMPAHAAVLDARNTKDNPAIGVSGHSHVVIDGFVIPNPGDKGIAVFGTGSAAKGIVIQNNVIYGVFVNGLDNTEAIRLENAQDIIVRNNKIYDVHNSGNSSNASGIKTYKVHDVLIENNEIHDVVAAVKDKEASSRVTIRNNRFTDCSYGFVLNNQNGGVTEAIHYHNNIVACSSGFDSATQSAAVMRDVHIYNNTFIDYRSRGIGGNEHGQEFRIYNNIFHRSSTSIDMADFYTRLPNTDQVKMMDYNLYLREPKMIVGLYGLNETITSLTAWQRKGLDANSRLGDPRFVDASKGDYRLAAGSPALSAGRDNQGRTVNIGAYATGQEVIGLMTEASRMAPSPPRLLVP